MEGGQIPRLSGPYFPVFKIVSIKLLFSLNTGKYGPVKSLYLDAFHEVIIVFTGRLQFSDIVYLLVK